MKRVEAVKGFTLIELMIALGIATVIVLGLYSFLVNTQRTYLNVASNEQGNRRVMNANNAMLNYLNQAGFAGFIRRYKRESLIQFRRSDSACTISKVTADTADGSTVWRDICVDYAGTDNYGKASPRIYVHYAGSSIDDQFPVVNDPTVIAGRSELKEKIRKVLGNPAGNYADNRSFICSGESIDNSHEVVVRLSLRPHEGDGDKSSDLICETVYDNGQKNNPQAYVLERNIDKLSIRLYVCASASGGTGNSCGYRTYDKIRDGLSISSSSRWDKGIGAVRYVMLQSEDSGQKVQETGGETYLPWSDETELWDIPSDSRVRQIIANEAFLRNGGYE